MKKYRNLLDNMKIKLSLLVLVATTISLVTFYFHETEVMPQSSIYFLEDAKLPSSGQNVLVFTPHPDDETIGVGGYIIESVKRGANVKIVLVTDGNKHGLKAKRYDEFKKATGILGVSEKNLVYLNYGDGSLKNENQEKLYNDFNREIKAFNPNFVLYTDPGDTHPDHAATGKVVEEVLQKEQFEDLQAYRYIIHHPHFPQPKEFKKNLYLLPPVKLVRFDEEWQRFMLSDEEENQKFEAISTYKTQIRVPLLRSLMLSFVRKNELLSISSQLVK
ncbi:MAG: PIG-L family deacetylase [Patescibacteria group bacterium]|nr:PIG-L family deacetylase [Patescibacteria group bacterium]